MRRVLLIFCCIFISLVIKAQNVQSITNINVQQGEDQIVITYDVNDENKRNIYEVNVRVFDSSSYQVKIPSVTSGDIGPNITVGPNKKITIPLTANALPKASRYGVSFYKVEKFTANEKNAVSRSLMIPGWGDRYVFNNGKRQGYFVTAISYGCIGYGIYSKIIANKEYKNYQNAFEQNDMDAYYDNAINKNKQFIVFTSVGVGLWALDVVRVSLKYKSNQKLFAEKGIAGKNFRNRIDYCVIPPLNKYQPSMLYFSYKF